MNDHVSKCVQQSCQLEDTALLESPSRKLINRYGSGNVPLRCDGGPHPQRRGRIPPAREILLSAPPFWIFPRYVGFARRDVYAWRWTLDIQVYLQAIQRRLTDKCNAAQSMPYTDVKAQKAFEKGLLEKTAKQSADIILYDNRIVLYKNESDVMIYVVGGTEENELMLYNVVLALRDSMHLIFKYVLSAIYALDLDNILVSLSIMLM